MPRRLITSMVLLCALVAAPSRMLAATASKVVATKHNLSAGGVGRVKVAGETMVCKFCHVPHSPAPMSPVWNKWDRGVYYETYQSKTLKASVGQPTGSSRLCLSCHDGTIALSQANSQSDRSIRSIVLTPTDPGYLGTNLSDDHPISFVYNAGLAGRNRQLRSPAMSPNLPVDHEGRLQCTTCHNPHDDSFGKFLRMDNRSSRMCISCHDMQDWASSSHATASSSVSGAQRDRWENVPYKSVRELACEGCHRPHSAGGAQWLMRHEIEEDNCFSCHDGTVAGSPDLTAEFRKISVHPVDLTTGVHEPTEDPRSMQKHVECTDCHNPHGVSGSGITPSGSFIQASMKGVSGLTNMGVPTAEATYEQEVCYKCHAKRNPVREPLVDRVIRNNDIADKFSVSSASFHPIEGVGKNPDVPSLLDPLRNTTIIRCTSCHGSDGQVRGPHGSTYRPLLINNYQFENADSTSEGPFAYALCYNCHNRASILRDESFQFHSEHLEAQTSCSACHDPHGVRQNTHLINFDKDVVTPSQAAPGDKGPLYVDLGLRRGSCTLFCHGRDHVDETYGP